MEGEGVKEESVVSVEMWDFAGQELYYASHPVFLTSRAIYILVCNLSKSLKETAQPCVRQGSHNFMLDNPNGETNLENLLSRQYWSTFEFVDYGLNAHFIARFMDEG